MGQTLTHGVYLPDEGERNCYSGLAANWQLLDGAVGTIAEHTSALSGKAPLVHTHTKSDITDFPVYGTTAGTICEGNDSRLSDARTPVAHTHTKSDVTDLFNSANTWSEDNTFNNIKSKGLTLTNNGRIYTEVPSLTKGTLPSSTYYYSIQNNYALDSSSANNRINQKRCYVETNGTNAVEWNLTAWGTTNIAVLRLSIAADGTNKTYLLGADTIPGANNTYNLGNSTNKWKTLNGINPGALSLPGAYQGINDQIKDPNGQLNAFNLNGGSNTWVSDVDCYLYFYIPNNKFTWIRIFWPPTLVRCGQTFVPVPNESSDYSGFVPVPANTTVVIQVKGTQAPIFRRSACLGNV